MKRRLFKLLVAVSLMLCVATIVLWVRSYSTADRLHGRVWDKHSFIIASKQGHLAIVLFKWHGAREFAWCTMRFPADDSMSFPLGPTHQYVNRAGFGTIVNPSYHGMPPVQRLPDGREIHLFGAASVVAERTDVGAPIAGARIWTGTIPGSPLSSVTLAEVGNRVQGSIRTLDATYSIEPAGDDASVLRQVDVAQGRPELPPVEAPIPDAAADLDAPQDDSGSTFDLLVVYNQAARSAAGRTSR